MQNIKLDLKPITLICVDCVSTTGAKFAMDACLGQANFGAAKLITSIDYNCDEFEVVKIDPITSIEAYSKFILTRLTEFVDTEFCLVVQNDGFIINKAAWNAQFYKYDYIGAPWWHADKYNVGNGGFSLRSKKLLDACANFNWDKHHPEDDVLCRHKGRDFIDMGFKFAPETIGRMFCWEPNPKYPTYSGQFGFHSKKILEFLHIQNNIIDKNFLSQLTIASQNSAAKRR